jgi:hypothetical protein
VSLIILEKTRVQFVRLFPYTEALFYTLAKISGVLVAIWPLVNAVAFVFAVFKSAFELVTLVTSLYNHRCTFTMSHTADLIAYVNFLNTGLELYH